MGYIVEWGEEMSTCFFIGHRDAPESIRDRLRQEAERHITQYGVTQFVAGQYGNFDRMAAAVVHSLRKKHPEIQLLLLLPYYPRDTELLENYEGAIYPEGMEFVPKRAAIVEANRYMIRNSEYIIAYAKQSVGNTRKLIRYAEKLGKNISNLAVSD